MLESVVERSLLAEPAVSYLQTRSLLVQYPQLGNRLSQPFFRALQVPHTCGARSLSGEAIAKSAGARLEFMVLAQNQGVGGRHYQYIYCNQLGYVDADC